MLVIVAPTIPNCCSIGLKIAELYSSHLNLALESVYRVPLSATNITSFRLVALKMSKLQPFEVIYGLEYLNSEFDQFGFQLLLSHFQIFFVYNWVNLSLL